MFRFLAAIPPTVAADSNLSNHRYVISYLDKPGDNGGCSTMRDVDVVCLSLPAHSALLDKLSELAKMAEATKDK